MIVFFQRQYQRYNSGERADLPEDQAQRLKALGIVSFEGGDASVPTGGVSSEAPPKSDGQPRAPRKEKARAKDKE